MEALNVPDVEPVLKKLATMSEKNYTNWIDVDFSHWDSSLDEKVKFNLLKTAIINKNRVVYGYVLSFGDYGEVLEPEHVREIIKRKLENNFKKYL